VWVWNKRNKGVVVAVGCGGADRTYSVAGHSGDRKRRRVSQDVQFHISVLCQIYS
jgi:hypothetical protein